MKVWNVKKNHHILSKHRTLRLEAKFKVETSNAGNFEKKIDVLLIKSSKR